MSHYIAKEGRFGPLHILEGDSALCGLHRCKLKPWDLSAEPTCARCREVAGLVSLGAPQVEGGS